MKSIKELIEFEKFPDRTLKNKKEKEKIAKPFIQWVGGKRQLIAEYNNYFPLEYNNYYEPFLGGGAVFYWQHSKFGNDKKYFLSDLNKELVIAFNVVKNSPEKLYENLEILDKKHSKEFYYKIRNIDRKKIDNKYQKIFDICEELNDIDIASRFIYLNRTCFNGIYRVSSDGTFNVPVGKILSRSLFSKEQLLAISAALQSATIINKTYLESIESAEKGDLVFFDPPYEPISKTSSFTSYTTEGFNFEDQKKLKLTFDMLVDKGCKVLLSNSNNQKIIDLYSSYSIKTFEVNRNLNSNAKKRKDSASEILVIS